MAMLTSRALWLAVLGTAPLLGCGPARFANADFRFTSNTYLKLEESALELDASPKAVAHKLGELLRVAGATNIARNQNQLASLVPPDGARCLEAKQAIDAKHLEAYAKEDVAAYERVDPKAEHKERGVEPSCRPRSVAQREGIDGWQVSAELTPHAASIPPDELRRLALLPPGAPRSASIEEARASTTTMFTSQIVASIWREPKEKVTHVVLVAAPMRYGTKACSTCTIEFAEWKKGAGEREAALVRSYVTALKEWGTHGSQSE